MVGHIFHQEAGSSEIDRSLEFLRSRSLVRDNWTMGYPYGGFNDSLLQVLRTAVAGWDFPPKPALQISTSTTD